MSDQLIESVTEPEAPNAALDLAPPLLSAMLPESDGSGTLVHHPEQDVLIERFIIGGVATAGAEAGVLQVRYPADPTILVGSCYQLQAAQRSLTQQIEQAALDGAEVFKSSTPEKRSAILMRLAELLEANAESVASLITSECGKPITLARIEVKRAIGVARGYAIKVLETAPKRLMSDGRSARLQYFPIGPVLAITPFNFPLNLVMHKLAPAIAAGCSITIKPSPKTPLTALCLGWLAVEAGYNSISVVPATNEATIDLVQSPVFQKLSFTGGADIGWQLKMLAAKKSVTLELGGNGAVIIDSFSEPLEQMAARIAFGAFAYSGQVCIAVQRILIKEDLIKAFHPVLIEAIRALKVGDPMKEKTIVGPMIDAEAYKRSRSLLKDAVSQGANVVYGGTPFNETTLNPALVDRVTPTMAICAEEVFAPIATLETYQTIEDAIALVNASRYGLQTGLYSDDESVIQKAFEQLEVGGLMVNDIPTYRSDELPYGGVKDSGCGKEGIFSGIAEYSVEKLMIQKGAAKRH